MVGVRRRSAPPALVLTGRRVQLRSLEPHDFVAWREVRRANAGWLEPWEPARLASQPDVVEDPQAFGARCEARRRERQMGTGFAFGVFVDGEFAGEINLSSVQRGAFQSAYVGYWMDERRAGQGYMPEALVVLARFAFTDLRLHRIQVAIIPRNDRSLRVVDKLGFRNEGVAERYLEINGVWEDHVRFAMTAEEWAGRGPDLVARWLDGGQGPGAGSHPTG